MAEAVAKKIRDTTIAGFRKSQMATIAIYLFGKNFIAVRANSGFFDIILDEKGINKRELEKFKNFEQWQKHINIIFTKH